MIGDPEGTVLALFAAFCRIGACFTLLPGIGSFRVPMLIRLFIALAVSMAILPLMWDAIYPRVQAGGYAFLALIAGELLIGSVLGLIARIYVLALQFAGASIAMMIGFNSLPGPGIDEQDPQSDLSNLISFTGLLILFMLDFHHVVIATLTDSYNFMPIGGFEAQPALISITDTLAASFLVMLRLSSPFIIYGLTFNLAVGMVNKLAPQIPVYFISLPFLIAGGLILLLLGSQDFFRLFADAFEPVYLGL